MGELNVPTGLSLAVAAPSIVIFSTPFSLLVTLLTAFAESVFTAAVTAKGKAQKKKERMLWRIQCPSSKFFGAASTRLILALGASEIEVKRVRG